MNSYMLFSQIRFLQIFPYSNYFCKDCSCEILDTRYVCNALLKLFLVKLTPIQLFTFEKDKYSFQLK